MANTLIVYHPTCLKHCPRTHERGHFYHPDNAERIRRVVAELQKLDIDWHEPKPVQLSLLEKVHHPGYISSIEAYSNGEPIDYRVVNADTPFNKHTFEAALLAAGGVAEAVDAVIDGKSNAFVIARPGGHHAEYARGMGFCIFNNTAVGAKRAQEKGLEKIAILDWDVHHGNGTQQIFYKDPSVLYISLHQGNLFPTNSGHSHEQGLDEGKGYNWNFPFFAGTVTGTYLSVFDREVMQRLERFKPDMIFIDAGFDAHQDDPLGQLKLSDEAFTHMTQRVKNLAAEHCRGRIVSVLAGGYNIETLPQLVGRHVKELSS